MMFNNRPPILENKTVNAFLFNDLLTIESVKCL